MPEIARTIDSVGLFTFWIIFFNMVLLRRYRLSVTVLVQAAALGAAALLSLLFPFEDFTFRLLISFSLTFGSALLLFREQWPRILLSVLMAHVWLVSAELLMIIVFPDMAKVYNWIGLQPRFTQVNIVLLYLCFNALMMLVTAAMFNRYRSRLSAREWTLYLLFPLSQIMITVLWFRAASTDTPAVTAFYQTLSLLVCLAADAALFLAVRGMAQRTELKEENALLARQIDAQKEHYAALTAQYEDMRRVRHDIASHVYTIRLLLEEKKLAEASSYAAELIPQQNERSWLGSCENPVVDAYLFNRMEEARRQGVEITAEVALPDGLQIANADLVSALGNLLENAIEACAAMERPAVRLSARVSKGFVIFATENPEPAGGGSAKKRRIPELERGVGFHILKELAKKYKGNFSFASGAGVFRAILTMKDGRVGHDTDRDL